MRTGGQQRSVQRAWIFHDSKKGSKGSDEQERTGQARAQGHRQESGPADVPRRRCGRGVFRPRPLAVRTKVLAWRADSRHVQSRARHKPTPFRCRDRRNRFLVRLGTVIGHSNLEYPLWAVAIHLFMACLAPVRQ